MSESDSSALPASSALTPRSDERSLTARLAAGRHPSSMVDRPGWLLRSLIRFLLASVAFATRCVDSLQDAHQRGTVVMVMRSRSIIDYMYFNVAFLERGLPLVRFANGINTWFARRFWSGLGTLLRGRRGLPSDEDCMSQVLDGGAPAMLFLERSTRKKETQTRAFSLPFLERLVSKQRTASRPILLVPQLLVWDKRPDRDRPTLLDGVFGTRQSPGFIKRALYVVQNFWQSFLNLGEPTVQVSSTLNLKRFVEDRSDATDLQVAEDLRNHLLEVFERESRVIVGPGVKPARQIRAEILADPRNKTAITTIAEEEGIDRTRMLKDARKILQEIGADFNLFAIKLLSSGLTPIFNQIYEGIDIDIDGLDRVRKTALDSRLVLVPSHKSHVDYLVISYIFYRQGLIPPHIAAGVNLSFWPLGPLFRRSGAFFLRRTFVGDPLYAALFNAYLVKLLEEGFAIEFFIEGTRSRTGKLNAPKYGMLNMIVDAFRSGNVDRLAFVPVSVGYENVIEGSTYKNELGGGEKKGESVGGLLQTSKVLTSKYGRVYVEFGEPIDLARFVSRYHDDPDEIERADLERTVRRLAYQIIHGINDVTTVTPSAVAALILLNSPDGGVDTPTLVREAGFVMAFLNERNARLSGSLRDPMRARAGRLHKLSAQLQAVKREELDEFDEAFLDNDVPEVTPEEAVVRTDHEMGVAVQDALEEAIRLLSNKKLIEIKPGGDPLRFLVPEDRRLELMFYRNNIVHYFVAEAVFAAAADVVAGDEVALDDVQAYARFLSRLLKYEFCFAERRKFGQVFQDAADYFAERKWIDRVNDTHIHKPSPRPAGFEFLRGLLLPTLEGYRLAVRTLIDLGDEWIDRKQLTRKAIAKGRLLGTRGELIHAESVAKTTLENAFKVFREWKVLEEKAEERGRSRKVSYRVTEEYQGELLEDLENELSALVSEQQRLPGVALRRL